MKDLKIDPKVAADQLKVKSVGFVEPNRRAMAPVRRVWRQAGYKGI